VTNVGFATLSVIPSFDGFKGKLERGTNGPLDSVGTSGGKRFGNGFGKSAGAAFGKTFKAAAKVGIGAAIALTAGAIKIGKDALDEAAESQKVGRQTAAVLKSTGGAAKVSQADVGKLANKLSYMAGVDDELVQSSENVLLTFKGIRNEAGKNNRIFDRGAKVALNMSKALGTDLKGASIQVGKALNDPVKGITALQRVGVSFTTKHRAQIKALVEGGTANAAVATGLVDSTTTFNNLLKEEDGNVGKLVDRLTKDFTPAQKEMFDRYEEGGHTLEAQKRILKELGSEFGGSARSQATASDRLKVAFGNVEEALGKGLLPMVQDFSRFLLREGVPAARQFVRWFKNEGVPNIKAFADEVRPLANQLLPAARDGFKKIRDFAKDALPFAEGIVGAFNDMPDWVKKVLIAGTAGGLAAKKLGLGRISSTVAGGFLAKGGSVANPLYVWQVNGGAGGGGAGPKSLLSGAGATAALIAAIAGGVTLGVGKVLGPDNVALLGAGSGGSGGLAPSSGKQDDFFNFDEDKTREQNERVERQRVFVERLGQEWLDTKTKANDYNMFVRNKLPGELKFSVLGWPLAQKQARDYLATLLEIRDLRMDTRLDRAGVTSPTAGGGIDPSNGTRPHGRPRDYVPQRGVVQNFYGDIRPNDPKEFAAYTQRKSVTSYSTGGW
jgi:hypothetical protein